MKIIPALSAPWCRFEKILGWFAPVGDLIVRLYIAHIFFLSGLSKIQTWESTVFLFEHEYSVPLLSPEWAAVLATGVELVMPLLLAIGFMGRFPAFILFIFNIVAVWSYAFLWTSAGAEGFEDHVYWGLLLMLLMFHGHGKLSLDAILQRWLGCCKNPAHQ